MARRVGEAPAGGRGARERTGEGANGAAPPAAAAAAGLVYVDDRRPGISRRRCGRGWSYRDARGRTIRDATIRARIEEIGIPPAWTDVWICPDPRGHLLATGRDAAGRKQYRYHPRWREVRDGAKFDRMLRFGLALPALRERVDADLARPGLPREKVLATVVRLLETTCIRVGNEEYRRRNGSFGLTTLRDRHVRISGSTVRFVFEGKGGKRRECSVSDRRLARIVKRCQDVPGQELFQYLDESGERQRIGSGDVNAYLRGASGEDFTAKDFRTWMGTVQAMMRLCSCDPPADEREAKARCLEAVDAVAEALGNTRQVCRDFYVHPDLLRGFEEGWLRRRIAAAPSAVPRPGLDAEEVALLGVLRSTRARRARENGSSTS